MIKISIKDAQIGMVAAEPIKTPLGQILALPGTQLTRQLINKMKLYKVGQHLNSKPILCSSTASRRKYSKARQGKTCTQNPRT